MEYVGARVAAQYPRSTTLSILGSLEEGLLSLIVLLLSVSSDWAFFFFFFFFFFYS